jgi:hypothetical protein
MQPGNLRPVMTPNEESSPEESAPAKRARPRRSRRGGRGRKRPVPRAIAPTEAGPVAHSSETMTEVPVAGAALKRTAEIPEEETSAAPFVEHQRVTPPSREERHFKPASPAAVAEAIEVVTGIIVSLRQVLDQMEEILETLELAEVQKTADEREIQSLRNALRQLDRRGPVARHEPRREDSEHRGDSEPRRRDDRRHGRS